MATYIYEEFHGDHINEALIRGLFQDRAYDREFHEDQAGLLGHYLMVLNERADPQQVFKRIWTIRDQQCYVAVSALLCAYGQQREVFHIFVHEDYRGQGFGTHLTQLTHQFSPEAVCLHTESSFHLLSKVGVEDSRQRKMTQ